jgi:hypothetical protein
MQPLRRDKGEAIGEIESHLVAENRLRPRAGAVGFFAALVQDARKEIVILLHGSEFIFGRAV